MSFLGVVPDAVATASSNLESLGSALRGASDAAVRRTTAIAPPGADEISSAITRLFGSHGQEFAAAHVRASAFHAEFVKLLNGGAAQYVNAEIANAQQVVLNAINTPAQVLLGHPLIGSTPIASPAGAVTQLSSINTPFGPIAITQTIDFPSSGTGPLSAPIRYPVSPRPGPVRTSRSPARNSADSVLNS